MRSRDDQYNYPESNRKSALATIQDVAKAAGVSTATVSHLINKSRYVKPETSTRVLAAIDKLHYRVDGVARSLRRSSTGTIGLMISLIVRFILST